MQKYVINREPVNRWIYTPFLISIYTKSYIHHFFRHLKFRNIQDILLSIKVKYIGKIDETKLAIMALSALIHQTFKYTTNLLKTMLITLNLEFLGFYVGMSIQKYGNFYKVSKNGEA